MKMFKRLASVVLCLAITVFWSGTAAAGDPDYSGSPADGSGMPTLQEVYEYLINGTAETPNMSFEDPVAGPGVAMKSTREIYDDIKVEFDQCTATPDKVQSGVKFFSTASGNWGVKTGTMTEGGSCTAAVPKTGQTKCYNASAEQPCPVANFQDQDGQLQNGAGVAGDRFADNTDGTVTDNLTGLIWLKDANSANTTGYDTDGKVTWANAFDFVGKLNNGDYGTGASGNCGQSDWRLPNLRELQSLIDYGVTSPALPSGHPFTSVQTNYYYWSSTTCASSSSIAWGVYLDHGGVGYNNKSSTYYVLPVRGGQ
ncbi:DUF1566 domain-containing protein [Desulfobacterales bacterium HSG2]|nr:DUF1566 domain-containing protein [Desulfobacterales bacterium HSG2]